MRYRLAADVAIAIGVSFLAADSAVAGCQHCKNTIDFPVEPFAVGGYGGNPAWIKLTILTADPATVIFQDGHVYPFHYDFATAELPQFAGMTPAQFDAVTLHAQGQQAILGAVILPPFIAGQNVIPEYGIQLVRQDPYDPVQVRDLFLTIKSKVQADPGVQAFYFPSYEQQASAEQNAAWLASQGVIVSSPGRWADGNACYSHGWALGRLEFFPADQIQAAYLSGALAPDEVLLTDGVPADIPLVAGVISLAPSAPNSHVALLAQTFGVPFVHTALAADAQRAQDLVGRRMVLRADETYEGCRVRLIDVEGVLSQAAIDEILELKEPVPLDITPLEPYGAYSAPTVGLQLADIRYFGGKAANSGLLRRAIPASSPLSCGFSFDLWNAYLDQVLGNGRSLREEIALRLAPYTWPPNLASLSATLDGIQDLFRSTSATAFSPALQAAVIATLQDAQYGFDPDRNLRFRSSTNVEDTEQFTGAGLYDSFSGCLADDLDANTQGPSLCDPTESNERGVFRAIRRVFASFYYLNAYVERLRHAVNEGQVGMALLVHHSFPDPEELANGVATLTQGPGRRAYQVTQVGANPVTNPLPGQIPEEVSILYVSGNPSPDLVRSSNLVQLGDTVMEFPDEYEELAYLQALVANEYATASGDATFELDFEFKKVAPAGNIVVTQVRRIPPADDTPSITPFLVAEPTEYCVFQGEYGDVFGNHRLKSRWSALTDSLWLTPANLAAGFFADTTVEYAEVCQLYEQSGPLPQYAHAYAAGTALESWVFGSLQNPREHELTVSDIPGLVAPSASPVLVLRDFGVPRDYGLDGCLDLRVDYDAPVPTVDWTGPTMTTTDYAALCPCRAPGIFDLLQERTIALPGGVTIETDFYWPPPVDLAAGYTAPLVRFVGTTIAGLTSSPIVLAGEYSQTYRPEHHNFGENFLFEPALEPGIAPALLAELDAAGIRAIYVRTGFAEPELTLYGEAAWGACLQCTGFDADDDGYCTADTLADCDDARADLWATPLATRDLLFTSHTSLTWSAPSEPGATVLRYDVLRSPLPGNFLAPATCLESDDAADRIAVDPTSPPPGKARFYLTRAENDCPDGQGSLGLRSSGVERLGRTCP